MTKLWLNVPILLMNKLIFALGEEEDDDGSINIGNLKLMINCLFWWVSKRNRIWYKPTGLGKKIFDFGSFDDFHSKEFDSLVPNLEFNINPEVKKKCLRENRKGGFWINCSKLNILTKNLKCHYGNQNWPEGVGLIWDRWKKAEIEKIYKKMPEFVFWNRTINCQLNLQKESGNQVVWLVFWIVQWHMEGT